MTGVFIKREETQSWTHDERALRDFDRGRDSSSAAASQGVPRTAGNHEKLGRGKEGFVPIDFRESITLLLDF